MLGIGLNVLIPLSVTFFFFLAIYQVFYVYFFPSPFSDSDDSVSELALDGQSYLMDEVGLVEGALSELSPQLQIKVCGSHITVNCL